MLRVSCRAVSVTVPYMPFRTRTKTMPANTTRAVKKATSSTNTPTGRPSYCCCFGCATRSDSETPSLLPLATTLGA